jgi:DNA-binding transcriptional ArsR family regulator
LSYILGMDMKTFGALAEPNRVRIVELLKEQPRSVNEVALLLGIRQPQASKHLHTLSAAGLVSMQPVAQQRIYALNPEPFLRLEDWVGSFHRFWDQRFDSLDSYLKQ